MESWLPWRGKPQQLRQRTGSCLMHGLAHQHLYGFQIQAPGFTRTRELGLQQLLYFARDFMLDSLRRFFSCGVRMSSTGRKRQIFSLTSRNEWLSS